ncbi:MAG: hypothetical protein QOE70_1429 [Chthoniobacter sp.]|jgi:hypothetical protein|nr:hypothetical protein [Chthoniobacter sp.]
MKLAALLLVAFAATLLGAIPAPNGSEQPRMEEIAKQTLIPRIAVRDATIREVIAFARHRTKELPPLKKELNVVYIGRVEPAKRITLELLNVPLLELLRAAARQADLQITITDDAIYLFPKNEEPPLLPAVAAAAKLPKVATLDDVLRLAVRPEQPTKENGYDVERCDALKRLQEWPAVAPQDEARIATAFTISLRATNGNIRNAGAWGLGRRGHSEAIPAIFELGEKDSNLIGCFFQLYTHGREVQPPLDLLRRGLRSKNPDTRCASLFAVVGCKAISLRPEVETLLAADPTSRVRDEAASTLSQLRLRASAPALRRALAAGLESGGVVYGLTQLGSDDDIAAVLPLLKSKREDLRRIVAAGLATAQLANSQPACDALLEALHDPSSEVRGAVFRALVHFGSPSSGRAVWAAYLKDPIRASPGSSRIGYYDGLEVLAACADAELLRQIQDRLTTTKDNNEKSTLEEVVSRIQTRLNK